MEVRINHGVIILVCLHLNTAVISSSRQEQHECESVVTHRVLVCSGTA